MQYFNSLPLKLPLFNNPPHTPNSRGAIQTFVYNSVAGGSSTSLRQSLLAIPLPTTAGSDLQIYNAAVLAAVEQSLVGTLAGVGAVFSGGPNPGPGPNNRYGIDAHTSATIPAYILGTTTTGTG